MSRSLWLLPTTLILTIAVARAQVPDEALSDEARPYLPAGLEHEVRRIDIERHGPVVTATLELAITNPDIVEAERMATFVLPADAVLGRLALDVDGRWMEAEVLSQLVASQHYEGIVRPAAQRPRDPAHLTEERPGHWRLRVFPVPPKGERHLVMVIHRLEPAKPGTWIEDYPALGGIAPARWFAVVPAGAKPAGSALVVALDLSLSMRDQLRSIGALLDTLRRARPGKELVIVWLDTRNGAVRSRSCADPACFDLAPGGGTDLGALLAAAFAEADKLAPDAEVVLVSDGRGTEGTLSPAELVAAVGARGGGHRLSALALGDFDRVLLGALGERARGALAFDSDELARALMRPFKPALVDAPPGAVSDVAMLGGVVFGRLLVPETTMKIDAHEVTLRAPDKGRSGPSFHRLAALARLRPYELLDTTAAAKARLQIARSAGIAAGGGAFLALEKEDDYVVRGIVRTKAAELAAFTGTVGPVLPADWSTLEEVAPPDADGDGFPDRLDACPDQPGPDQGCFPRRVLIQRSELRILEKVFFPFKGTALDATDGIILDEVAKAMLEYPMLTIVGLEGHADTHEGWAAKRLSQRRAEAARNHLIERGIAPARLVAYGWGVERPIAPNTTRNGRAMNRRVELHILSIDGNLSDFGQDLILEGMARAHMLAVRARKSDDEQALKLLTEALAIARTPADEMTLFDDALAVRFPALFQPAALATIEANAPIPAEVVHATLQLAAGLRKPAIDAQIVERCAALDARTEPIFCANFLAAQATPRAREAFRKRVDAYLALLEPVGARVAAPLEMIDVSATLLDIDGRPDEARVRRAEVVEIRREREGYKAFTR